MSKMRTTPGWDNQMNTLSTSRKKYVPIQKNEAIEYKVLMNLLPITAVAGTS